MRRRIFTNARVVTPREVFLGTVEIHVDRIARVELGATSLPGAEDLGGDFLLPGLVDLFSATLQMTRHRRPDLLTALCIHDLAASSSGVTTVLHGLPLAGPGTPLDESDVGACIDQATAQGLLRADHHGHLELGTPPAADAVAVWSWPRVRLVSSGGNWRLGTPPDGSRIREARLHCRQPEDIAWAAEARLAAVAFPETVSAMISAQQRGLSVILLSRDIVETQDAWERRADGEVVAGLTAFASWNEPHRLLQTPFALRDRAGWSLQDAVRTVSTTPARLAGLEDRGCIATGRRADFVRVRLCDGIAFPMGTWRGGRQVA